MMIVVQYVANSQQAMSLVLTLKIMVFEESIAGLAATAHRKMRITSPHPINGAPKSGQNISLLAMVETNPIALPDAAGS